MFSPDLWEDFVKPSQYLRGDREKEDVPGAVPPIGTYVPSAMF
jgi:hypothetical protein